MQEESFDIFDENNQPLGLVKSRDLVHKENKNWHRTTHVWIINENNQILCQQRSSTKDKNPDKWQSFFGGHLKAGQTYEENAISELDEELGFNITINELIPLCIRKSESQKHFAQIYILKLKKNLQNLHFNDGEVSQVKWFSLKELGKAMLSNEFCNSIDNKVKEYLLQC